MGRAMPWNFVALPWFSGHTCWAAPPPRCQYVVRGSVPTPQEESQLELHSRPRSGPPLLPAAPDQEVQRKRMLIALGVLLVALVAVVLKDWDFWFPPSDEVQDAARPRLSLLLQRKERWSAPPIVFNYRLRRRRALPYQCLRIILCWHDK